MEGACLEGKETRKQRIERGGKKEKEKPKEEKKW
jgi:hypothetical protein